MNCRTCGYALWNLGTRACPECGTAFLPSEYTFPPGAVRFCCRSCNQAYYGTDAHGHLLPPHFTCVTCGSEVEFNATIVRPIEGEPVTSGTTTMPWLRRDEIGLVRAWFKTLGAALAEPSELIRSVPDRAPVWPAIGLLAGNLALFTLVGQAPLAIFQILALGQLPPGAVGTQGIRVALWLLVFGVSLFLAAMLWIVLAHGVMKLLRATTLPMSRTAHAVCYSSPAAVLVAAPCMYCLVIPGVIWWVVAGTIMAVFAHRERGGRVATATALGAVLAFVVVPTVSFGVYMNSVMGGAGGRRGMFGPLAPINAPAPVSFAVAAELISWPATHGRWPGHGLELLESQGSQVTIADLASSVDGAARAREIPGAGTLDALALNPQGLPDAAHRAAESLPADVVVHRVGEWLFCWHGVDPDAHDPSLWIALRWPWAPEGPPPSIDVIHLDGTVQSIAAPLVPPLLDAQNRARRVQGIPELPTDLGAVTENAPG